MKKKSLPEKKVFLFSKTIKKKMLTTSSFILPDGSVYSGTTIVNTNQHLHHHHHHLSALQQQQQSSTSSSPTNNLVPHGLGIRLYLSSGHNNHHQGGGTTTTTTNRNNNLLLYVGEWDNGLMQGKGLLLSDNGDTLYEGNFFRGQCHGRGFLYTRSDDKSRRGVWEDGHLVSSEEVFNLLGDDSVSSLQNGSTQQQNQNHPTSSFKPVSTPTTTSTTTNPNSNSGNHRPIFRLLETEAILQTMKDLRNRLEQSNIAALSPSSSSYFAAQQPQFPSLEKSASGFYLQQQATGIFDSANNQTLSKQHPSNKNLLSTATSRNDFAIISGQQQQQQQNIQLQQQLQDLYLQQELQQNFVQQQQQQQQQHEPFGNVPANAAITDQSFSNQLLITVSGPSYNFAFSVLRFLQVFFLFIFPFLSLPGIPLCPLRMDGIDLEREYVVSGAALRADFELPSWEIYFDAVAIIFLVVAGAVTDGWYESKEGVILYETSFAFSDLIVPIVLILLFAFLQASYQSYHRTAHALERLDRHHFPKLAALSAQAVDASCHTLVVSWDEEGLGRVMNKKYKYKWAIWAVLYGFLLGFSSPIVRMIRNQNAFANEHKDTEIGAIMVFLSIWTISAGITYQFWRILDLERQLVESMTVITRCAYLKGQSILRPSDNRKFKFHFDAPISMEEISQGFLGWYIVRSFALYASTLANHKSRHAFVSVLALSAIAVDGAVIIDTFRALRNGSITFTTAHGFAVAAIFGWSNMLLYFLYVANAINQEVRKHLYLVDVAGMFHLFRDPVSANILSRCRGFIAEHDYASKVLGIRITDKVMTIATLYHGLAVACIIVSCVMWGFELRGTSSDLLKMF
jgi:hypothetical protein